MENSQKVCIGVSVLVGTTLAAAGGFLAWNAWGNQDSSVVLTGGVSTGEVTQLDRVSALNDSQSLQGAAEAEYTYAGTEQDTVSLDRAAAEDEDLLEISEEDLTEYELTTAQTAVYTKASTDSSVVCYILPGTLLSAPAQEAGQDWYEVYYKGLCGYVQASCLEVDVDGSAVYESVSLTYDDVYGELLTDEVLYSEASESSDAVLTLEAGETVELVSAEGGWYYAYYDGSYGYLIPDYVDQSADKPDWKVSEEKAQLRSNVVATAKKYLGCSYVWAADGPSSFDCSGFTMYVMSQYGVSLPHSAARQYSSCGTSVSKSSLQQGDLVFFSSSGSRVSHVGIYIGNGQFIHASSATGDVTISSLSDSWYSSHYVGAKRVL